MMLKRIGSWCFQSAANTGDGAAGGSAFTFWKALLPKTMA